MGLNTKQAEFTYTLGKFLVWCHENEYPLILAEVYRTPEQANLNAESGAGISNSLHIKKLAADAFRLVNGTVSWDIDDYRIVGEHWKTLHELARWGGDFKDKNDKPKPDAVHFSFEHEGVK